MWRALKYGTLGLVLTLAGMAAYGQVKPRFFPVTPPPMVPVEQRADAIFVDKSDRVLQLLRDGTVINEYPIALSRNPLGHKTQEGDYSTPVGTYEIDWRNARSIAHLSLHISYPNEADRASAQARGVSPGGDIMIHGFLNGWGPFDFLTRYWDWTAGCIAVTNADMEEIWAHVADGTPITIQD